MHTQGVMYDPTLVLVEPSSHTSYQPAIAA